MKTNRKINISFNAPVVIGFTAVCFAALVLGWITKGWTTNTFFSVYHSSLLSPLTYVRMVGHVFGHAGWEHFIGNIMLLLIVGITAGRKVWFIEYFVCHPRNGTGDRGCELYLFPACAVAWRKRRGVCVYPVVTIHQREGGKHTNYIGACGGALYRGTDIQRYFYKRQRFTSDAYCRRLRGSRAWVRHAQI